mmetsp:Transcript_67041/g.126838  ORF Transcript_67041/g.126838 Transcript_67041/m.126838 type:complete len:90 (+) Transcript_67041:2-271(+)
MYASLSVPRIVWRIGPIEGGSLARPRRNDCWRMIAPIEMYSKAARYPRRPLRAFPDHAPAVQPWNALVVVPVKADAFGPAIVLGPGKQL